MTAYALPAGRPNTTSTIGLRLSALSVYPAPLTSRNLTAHKLGLNAYRV